ncbi:hypothetical protein BTA51_22735 [Hahella sp. CCB-MM4]|uniref:sensor histidine kinase n=1 Tax=Hahella sp. (strain CCB-MM4) TaxID=1926491 RepID=UPI000BC78CB1|nr:HAMP domain-containing sensor histidine kinase [Hahella sp. CCB-MM4]OZG71188.1 hypothetical protein BTA51_22735 [Hahella sp. CCB-MM4]
MNREPTPETSTQTCRRRKGLHSLSVRLTLTFLLTGFLLVILVIGAFRFSAEEHIQMRWRDMLVDYVATITSDIGPPFTKQQADYLAERTKTQVSIQSQDGHWTPAPPPFDPTEISWNDTPDPDLKTGRRRSYFAISRKTPEGTILFYDRPIHGFNFLTSGTLISLGLIILVIFACFHYVKALLRPIHTLTSAAEEVREGNLEVEVAVKRMDELGVLTSTFNSMSHQIKRMLDAKHQLLIALSHELRSPLTRLRMAGELLPESDNREGIINDCRVMEKIISDIMEGEQLEGNHSRLNFQAIAVSKVIQDSYSDFPTEQKRLIELQPSPEVTVTGDPVRLKILFRNLIQNALIYSDGLPVKVEWKMSEQNLVVTMTDQGPGFQAEDLQHIGEPFFRADKARRHHHGSGMGLYLCKLICKAHGGELQIGNRPQTATDSNQTGAEVRVVLPLTPH